MEAIPRFSGRGTLFVGEDPDLLFESTVRGTSRGDDLAELGGVLNFKDPDVEPLSGMYKERAGDSL